MAEIEKLEEIHEDLRALSQQVGRLATWQQVHGEEHKRLSDQLGEHHETLFDPRLGVVGRLQAQEQTCRTERSIYQRGPIARVGESVVSNVVSGTLLALLFWLLWLHQQSG